MCSSLRAAALSAGLTTVQLSAANLSNTLDPQRFSWLALADAPSLPASAAGAFVRFAEAGRGLIMLGGRPPRLNTSREQVAINLMSTYEPYYLDGASGVQQLNGSFLSAQRVTGLSAVGWYIPGEIDLSLFLKRWTRTIGASAGPSA